MMGRRAQSAKRGVHLPLILAVTLACLLHYAPGQAEEGPSSSLAKTRGPLFRYVMEFGEAGVGPGQFKNPSGIDVDQAGNIYVADTDNDRVQRFSPRGVYLDQAGGFGRGEGQFNRPVGVAAGFGLEVFVADSRNRRISIFTQDLRLAGLVGGDQAAGAAFELGFLGGVAVSRGGQVYVTDSERSEVVRITHFNRKDRGFGGIGYGGGELVRPTGIAVSDDGTVYVADTGNDRVVAFDAFGGLLAAIGEGLLRSPLGLAVAPGGTLVVADSGQHRIVFLGGEGYPVVGEMGRMGDGPMSFDTPRDIAVDMDGYLYVLDSGNSRVQKFEMRWPG